MDMRNVPDYTELDALDEYKHDRNIHINVLEKQGVVRHIRSIHISHGSPSVSETGGN